MTITSWSSSMVCSCLVPAMTTLSLVDARLTNDVAGMANCRNEDRRRRPARGGAAAPRAAPGARPHPRRAGGGHRHLGQHAVPAGVGAAEADARAVAAAGPGPPGPARRARGHRSGRGPTGEGQADPAGQHDHGAADPSARRPFGVQGDASGRQRSAEAGPADPRGLRVALRAQRSAPDGAGRARPRARGRRGRGVRHPAAALVRRRRLAPGRVPHDLQPRGGADPRPRQVDGLDAGTPEGTREVRASRAPRGVVSPGSSTPTARRSPRASPGRRGSGAG